MSATPFFVINIVYIFVICYFVWHGPEVIARVSVVAFVLGLAFNLLVFVATFQEINFSRILPLFDTGLLKNGLAGLKVGTFIGQSLIVIAMFLPFVNNLKKASKPAVIGLSIGGIYLIFYFLAELMVMGSHVTAQMRIPCMDLVRAIQITEYLHRLESFMVALWYWSMLTQAGVMTYCFTLSARQTFGIKEQNRLLMVLTGVLLLGANYLLAYNRITYLNFTENMWQYISLPVQYGLPLLLVLVILFIKPSN